jgi:DNA-binding NtrC family response regulator
MYKVLIVDDDVAVTNYLMVFLAQTDEFESIVLNDPLKVPEVLARERFDVFLLDMDMPHLSGTDILKLARERGVTTPIVFLTGVSDVDLAVKAMKLGAFDYLRKPVEEEYLVDVLRNAIKYESTQASIKALPVNLVRSDLAFEEAFSQIPTLDPEMIRILHKVEKMAASDLPMLIIGKRGTMKELFAEAVHKISHRSAKPFIIVDAMAISSEAFTADLFGQERDWSGAHGERPGFLEAAEGGTLFLDNIDRLSMSMQMRVKRVIQSNEFYREKSTTIRKVDVRLIAASSFDLTNEDYRRGFSDDLLYHLMLNTIRIPPLRERPDDIPLLAEQILEEIAAKTGKRVVGFKPEFLEVLRRYDFPYNRSELNNIIAKAVVDADEGLLSVEHLPQYVLERAKVSAKTNCDSEPRKLSDIEREHVVKAVEFYSGDRAKAAKQLGVSLDELERITSS